MKSIVSLVFVLFGLSALACYAQTSSFVAVSDVTLIEDTTGGRATGSGDAIYVGRTQRDGERRGLLRFDLSSIPTTATITSATLRVHVIRARPEEFEMDVHRTLKSWGEGASNYFGGVGGPALAGDATWKHRFYGTSDLWTNLGGDFTLSPSATQLIGSQENVTYDITSAGLAGDVLGWVQNPALNFGWTLTSATSNSAKAFASKENTNLALQPRLIVNWTLPPVANDSGEIPLPWWAMTLLGIVLVSIIFRLKTQSY